MVFKLQDFLKKIAHMQVEHPYLSLLFIALVSIIIFGGVSKVQTVASLEKMMPKDIEEIKAYNILRDNNLGQDLIAVSISLNRDSINQQAITQITDIEIYEYIDELNAQLSNQNDIIESYSMVDVVEYYSTYHNLTYNEILENDISKEEINRFVNTDQSLTVIILSTDISSDDFRMNLLSTQIKEIIDDLGHPKSVKIELTGTPIIQQKLGELINNDRNSTQWISTLMVFLITALIFRSLTSAIVPILVVYFSVNFLYGTMGYTSLPISTLAGGVAAMVIGIGIDFAIHIINKFKYERKLKNSIKHSIELAVVHTGSALITTSLTTISAFLAFLFGVMPEMGRFGLLMAIGITYSLIFSIFGLPALLVVEEKIIYYIKRNFTFGIEHEFHLEENKEDKLK